MLYLCDALDVAKVGWLDKSRRLDRAALGLLDLADDRLRERLADYPAEAVAVIRRD